MTINKTKDQTNLLPTSSADKKPGSIKAEPGKIIEGVSAATSKITQATDAAELYDKNLDAFLSDFIRKNAYAQKIADIAKIKPSENIRSEIKAIYEKTGIDLIKEAFFQYYQEHKCFPPFHNPQSTSAHTDIQLLYTDDPRLHSETDQTLGEYIDDWNTKEDLSEEQKYWCRVAEKVREGLDPETEENIVNLFCGKIQNLGPKPTLITLIPSSNPEKPKEQYQMYNIAKKVSERMGIAFDPGLVNKNKKTGRVEQFNDQDKYFRRRDMLAGTFTQGAKKLENEIVLAIDDGWSSGASLDEIKKVCYENEAQKVYSMHLVRC